MFMFHLLLYFLHRLLLKLYICFFAWTKYTTNTLVKTQQHVVLMRELPIRVFITFILFSLIIFTKMIFSPTVVSGQMLENNPNEKQTLKTVIEIE